MKDLDILLMLPPWHNGEVHDFAEIFFPVSFLFPLFELYESSTLYFTRQQRTRRTL